MLSAKIRYEYHNGKILVGYDSGATYDEILKNIFYEVKNDPNLKRAYIVEVVSD